MTTILALDTALGACSVALVADDDGLPCVVAARRELRARGHAEALAPMISDIMRQAACSFADISAFGVTVGPGTFTGQRVGLATIRGMALAAGKPVHAMTTLEAIGANVIARGCDTQADAVAVAIDAKRGELYFQLYGRGLEARTDPALISTESVAGMLPEGRVVLAGTGAGIVRDRASQCRGLVLTAASPQPDAAVFAIRMLTRVPPEGPPEPLYLRQPDAKLPGKPVIARA